MYSCSINCLYLVAFWAGIFLAFPANFCSLADTFNTPHSPCPSYNTVARCVKSSGFCESRDLVPVLCLVAQSCPTHCNPMDHSLPGSSVHGVSPGKNTGVGCHALLQGIFPTQGSNPGLLHCRRILYHLSHQGRPKPSFLQPVPWGARAASKTSECPHPSPSLSPFSIKLQLSSHLF